MTTTTLFSKQNRFFPLYRSTLRRNAGYLGLLSALMFLFYPVQFALEAFKKIPSWIDPSEWLAHPSNPYYFYDLTGLGMNFTYVSIVFFTAIMLVVPVALGLMLNSYMHSKKAADVYHSLPVRRETMLLANAAVAMTMIAVPVVISNIAIAIMSTAKFGLNPYLLGQQFWDMCCWLIVALAIYAVTTLVSVLVGTVFDSLCFSGVMLFALPAIAGTFLVLCSLFLEGFEPHETTLLNLLLLSPVLLLCERLSFGNGYQYINDALAVEPHTLQRMQLNNIMIFVYLLIAIALLLLAARLYRSRRSELAETTGNSGILPLLVKLIGTMLSGIYAGVLFYAMNNESIPALITWTILIGMLAFAILEVIFSRGFKTLLKSLPIGGGMVAATLIGFAILLTGGFGYENRVPAAEQVAAVTISNYLPYDNEENLPGLFQSNLNDFTEERMPNERKEEVSLRESANIQAVLDYHNSVVEKNYMENQEAFNEAGEKGVWQRVQLQYELKNGGTISRTYQMISVKSIEKLMPLQVSTEYLSQINPFFVAQPSQINQWTIADPFGSVRNNFTLTPEENGQLLEAVRSDLAARSIETLQHPAQAQVAMLQFHSPVPKEGSSLFASFGSVLVTPNDQQTMRFLQSKKLLDIVKPNLAQCTTVAVRVVNVPELQGTSEGIIFTPSMRDVFGQLEITETQKRIDEVLAEKNNGQEPYQVYEQGESWYTTYAEGTYEGTNIALLTDPEDIAALAANIRPSWRSDERYIVASFYFQNNEQGIRVIIPWENLPDSLQNKCLANLTVKAG